MQLIFGDDQQAARPWQIWALGKAAIEGQCTGEQVDLSGGGASDLPARERNKNGKNEGRKNKNTLNHNSSRQS